MCSRVAVSTPRRAVRHAPAGLAGEHRQAQAHRAAVVAGPQRFVLVLSPPAGGVVPGSEAILQVTFGGRAVAWLVASSSAGSTDHFGCSACFLMCRSLSLRCFCCLFSWHGSSRAAVWLQCLRGACFFGLYSRVPQRFLLQLPSQRCREAIKRQSLNTAAGGTAHRTESIVDC